MSQSIYQIVVITYKRHWLTRKKIEQERHSLTPVYGEFHNTKREESKWLSALMRDGVKIRTGMYKITYATLLLQDGEFVAEKDNFKPIQPKQSPRKEPILRETKNTKNIDNVINLFEIEARVIQPWHIRLPLPKGTLDFYTPSGKATWLGTNKWFYIKNIEKFIREQYPDHPENKTMM